MTLGLSIVFFAAGLILKFAVTATSAKFDYDQAGTALIVVGIVGILIGVAEQFLPSRRA
jgi:ABC-type antimicrobial peptide transport system permease subunit